MRTANGPGALRAPCWLVGVQALFHSLLTDLGERFHIWCRLANRLPPNGLIECLSIHPDAQLRRTWAFVMTLDNSRHLYVEFVRDQTVATWLGSFNPSSSQAQGRKLRLAANTLQSQGPRGAERLCALPRQRLALQSPPPVAAESGSIKPGGPARSARIGRGSGSAPRRRRSARAGSR